MGEPQVAEASEAFAKAHKPHFRTPEPAVEVFSHLSAYYRNQKLLMQVPGPFSHHVEPDVESARMIIEGAMQEDRKMLTEMESKALRSAFHIPVAKTMVAHSPNEALLIAQQLGFPVAMKVNSPDITHKSDAGGVLLNLNNAHEVRAAYQHILDNVKHNRPNASMDGISIEPMIVKPNGRELMIGVTSDPVFGPVITFGAGGTAVEIMGDRAVALPPLNNFLVSELIQDTRIARMLGAFRNMAPANMSALEDVLLRVSEMVCELPLLKEMDINPLIIDENGALAADARVVVEYRQPSADRYAHMAIYPYPTQLVSQWQLADGTDITIRPIPPGRCRVGAGIRARLIRRIQILPLHEQPAGTHRNHAGALYPNRLQQRDGADRRDPRARQGNRTRRRAFCHQSGWRFLRVRAGGGG